VGCGEVRRGRGAFNGVGRARGGEATTTGGAP
jgi:hypothetical protein